MNKSDHYKKQLKYFGDEFGNKKEYSLASWQKRYVEIIKKYMLGKDYKGKTLIDIATGSGHVAVELSKLPLRVFATDLSPQAINNIEKYKKQLGLLYLTTIKCHAEKIPLSSESVDYIVANAILEHIPDEKKAINEWKRILKKGGKLFITVPLKFRYVWPFLWLPNYIHDKKIGHLRRYDKKSLEEAFDLPVKNIFYSGHLIKVLGIILSVITKSDIFSDYCEKEDRKKEKKVYGANNISVIFAK